MESNREATNPIGGSGEEWAFPPGFDFLKGLGLSDLQMQALLMKLPRVVNELLQGRQQYVEEEKHLISVRKDVLRQIGDLLVQNINASRNLFLTLATLSLAVIGAVISARATNLSFFRETSTLYIGIGLLGICVVASVLYLLNRLFSENRNLIKSFQTQQVQVSELIDLMRKYAVEMKSYEEYAAAKEKLLTKSETQGKIASDEVWRQSKLLAYIPKIICWSFLLGLGFIAFALPF